MPLNEAFVIAWLLPRTAPVPFPFPIAEFDRLVAVRCANPTMTRADIEAWQMMPWGV